MSETQSETWARCVWRPMRRVNAMKAQSTEFLRTAEAAAYLQVSRKYLETARRRGPLPRYVKIGRIVCYRRADLDQFMDELLRPRERARLDSLRSESLLR